MRTITKSIYSFNELSEEAKGKAVERLFDINVDHKWWEFIYEDAKNIGLKITSFEIERYCEGKFLSGAYEVAQAIIENHGETCETYKTAKSFLSEYKDMPEDDIEELEEDFLKSLLEDYRIILSHEYEYMTSSEAIIETIKANGYEFDEDGNLY